MDNDSGGGGRATVFFEPHDVEGSVLCQQGAAISASAKEFAEVGTGLRRSHTLALDGVDGDIEPPMQAAVFPVLAQGEQLQRATEVGGAAVTMFGTAVGEFNRATSRRNGRIEAEKTTEDRDRVYARLLPAHRRDVAELEQAAAETARMLRNPHSEHAVKTLWRAGLLPASTRALFDHVDLPRGRRHAMRRHLATLVRDGTLPSDVLAMDPAELADYLEHHPDLARRVSGLDLDDLPADVPGADLRDVLDDGKDPATIRRILSGLDPADAATLALLYSKDLRNTNGVPFALRTLGNNVAVTVERQRLLDRIGAIGPRDGINGPGGRSIELRNQAELDKLTERLSLYDSILQDDRQILLFKPHASGGDGQIAELRGSIGAHTKNALISVPGTGADLGNFDGKADRTNEFVDDRSTERESEGLPNDLVGITWLGTDMPDSLGAAWPGDSQDGAGKLADFSHELRAELDAAGASSGKVTAMGHSYGGATVGLAENEGLDADRILHVNSAGMGNDINDPDDLHAPKDRDRYSMTVPGDFINGVNSARDIGRITGEPVTNTHGADPDTFPGNTYLPPLDADGDPMQSGRGYRGHGAPLDQTNSHAWQQLNDVINGRRD